MNEHVSKILNSVEEIKENIKDVHYKNIMDSLMEINKSIRDEKNIIPSDDPLLQYLELTDNNRLGSNPELLQIASDYAEYRVSLERERSDDSDLNIEDPIPQLLEQRRRRTFTSPYVYNRRIRIT